MELTLSHFKQFTVGALSVTQDEHGYHFKRFTDTQRAAFAAVTPVFGDRADSTTGIRIDFHTDANAFCATVSADKFEVLIDNLTVYFERRQEEGTICIDLDGNDHRVTLILPCHTPGVVKSIHLEGETYIRPHTYTKKVAFYGDSITQGASSEKDSQSYVWQLDRYFDFYSMNFGVGGARFHPETVEDIGFDADIVFVSLGTNNFGSNGSMEQLYNDCTAYFDLIKKYYPNSKCFCVTPIWRADGDNEKCLGTIHDARRVIKEEAERRGFTIIDGFTLVPHRTEYYADERLHPNDLGFGLYSLNLVKALSKQI